MGMSYNNSDDVSTSFTRVVDPTIVVDSDGSLVSCTVDGYVSADYRRREIIKEAVKYSRKVRIVSPFGTEIIARLDTSLGRLAALCCAAPDRSVVLQAPQEVWDWIEEDYLITGEYSDEGDVFPDDLDDDGVKNLVEGADWELAPLGDDEGDEI